MTAGSLLGVAGALVVVLVALWLVMLGRKAGADHAALAGAKADVKKAKAETAAVFAAVKKREEIDNAISQDTDLVARAKRSGLVRSPK